MLNSQSKIAVCGAGAMGAGIAQVAAQAGHMVVVLDRDEDALGRGRKSVEKGASALLKRGKIDDREAAALTARVTWTLDVEDLADADLIIEAIVENPDIKRSLFENLERVAGDEAVIATNTSSLSVTQLAGGFKKPDRFLGLHFFNPAPIMKLVEIVSGAATNKEIATASFDLMDSWGKVAVNARDVPGFIVNRVARPFYSEGWRALEEGAADPATLDFLYRDLSGFRMGPFELGDLIGHDINYEAARSMYDAYFGRVRFTPSLAQGQLAAAGQLGRKTGRGVFEYGDGSEKPEPTYIGVGAGGWGGAIRVATTAPSLYALLASLNQTFETDDQVPDGFADVGDVLVGMSDGRMAATIAGVHNKPVVVLDWMRDPSAATAFGMAVSCEAAREAALAFARQCEKKAVILGDRPGLVLHRTLLQLVNCAADAVRDHVADPSSIDKAMMNGVNYPFGPMAWAKEAGYAAVVSSLVAIANETGDTMYRPNEVLRSLALKET